jgi:hypothetical protein
MNVIIETVSGVHALVTASSITAAANNWAEEVRKGKAEDSIRARKPRPGEVRQIANNREHDYR